MKFNCGKYLKTMKGDEPLKDERDMPVTVSSVCMNAVAAIDPKKNLSGEDKMKRYKLGIKLATDQVIDLTVDEAKLLKDCVGEFMAPIVVGQIWEMLDGNAEETSAKE